MTFRLLVWPQSPDGKPLHPDEPGWIVGWRLEGGTVVCGGILELENDAGDLPIVGHWDPKNVMLEQSSRVVPTQDGPWWAEDLKREPESQQQLLLYRPGVFYQHVTTWSKGSYGFFPNLLWRLGEAGDLVERLGKGESVECRDKDEHNSNADDDKTAEERKIPLDEQQVRERNLFKRLRCFVASHSMLVLHFKHAERFCSRVPFIQLCLLLRTDKSRYSSRQEEVKSYIVSFDRTISVAFNCLLGVLASVVFLHQTQTIIAFLDHAWKTGHEEWLRANIQWLETFPAGFKLNVPLTRNMGREITMLIEVHDSVCRLLWTRLSQTWILRGLGVTSALFGFTTLLAATYDLMTLATVHISAVATCFQAMHRTQVYLLASLWRLFRGKKRNVLRHRTDTMEYDSMQLLLGMILFTVVLFLFTTILVYYTFFTVLHLAVQILGVVVWVVYVTVRSLPLGELMLRARHPGWFTERVFLANVLSTSKRTITRLVTVRQSYASILLDSLAGYVSAILSALPTFACEVLAGKPCTIREVCLSSVQA